MSPLHLRTSPDTFIAELNDRRIKDEILEIKAEYKAAKSKLKDLKNSPVNRVTVVQLSIILIPLLVGAYREDQGGERGSET